MRIGNTREMRTTRGRSAGIEMPRIIIKTVAREMRTTTVMTPSQRTEALNTQSEFHYTPTIVRLFLFSNPPPSSEQSAVRIIFSDGRRDTRDQRGPNNSHDDQYHHDYSRDIANSSHGSHFRSQWVALWFCSSNKLLKMRIKMHSQGRQSPFTRQWSTARCIRKQLGTISRVSFAVACSTHSIPLINNNT